MAPVASKNLNDDSGSVKAARDARESQLDVPAKQRVAIFHQKGGPVSISEFDVPTQLNRGEALVHIIYTGVCHTDLHAMLGDWPADSKLPLIGGHEGAGVVVKLGDGSDEYVAVGQRVGVKWLADSCLACDMCRRGYEASCPKAENHGYTRHGTFSQFVVAAAKHLSPIPDSMPLDQAAPILCAGLTCWTAVKEAKLVCGEYCAITGAGGGLGHLAVQYAAQAGFRVIAIDTGEEKKQLCLSLGADTFIDFKESGNNLVEDIKKVSGDGQGPHAAIVAASGSGAYAQALDYLRPHGTLVAVGLPGGTEIRADVFNTVLRSLRIVGSYVGNRQDAIEALDIAASGRVRTHFKKLGLSDLPRVYEDMQEGRITGRVVLDVDK